MVRTNVEYILCAAIYYPGDEETVHGPIPFPTGVVLTGWRHHQIIELYHVLTGKKSNTPGVVQGFLTNKNRFVGRKEAGKIAFNADQTVEIHHELTSEDLY